MNRRLFGAFGVLAAVAFIGGGCKNDPLSDLDGIPAALVLDFTHLQIGVGQTATVTASVLDARSTPLSIPATFTACNNVVLAGTDTSYHPIPATSSRGVVTAQTPAPSCVVVQAAGFTDTVTVTAVPVSFTGALSSTTPKGGDTLTIASTPQLKFDPAAVTVTFGGGVSATLLSVTADTVKLLVPFSTAGPLTIEGVLVTSYTPALALTLPTATVTQTGDLWAGKESFATAPDMPLPAASGDTLLMVTSLPSGDNADQCAETAANFDFGSTGPCSIYKFTVGATTTLHIIVDWDVAATDIDIYACSAADPLSCFEDPGTGATGAKPQEFTFDFPAGTHYLVIEDYAGTAPSNILVKVIQP